MTTATLRKVVLWIVVVVLAVFLVVSWVGRQSRPAAAGDPQTTSSPTTQTTPSPTATPTATAISPSPSQESLTTERILGFEQAYRQLDPDLRREELRPYVTDKYLQELLPSSYQESEYLKSLREGVSSTLDLKTAMVNIEDLDETALEVFTRITKTTTSDGVSQTMAVTHVTFWIQDGSGSWRVDAESIN